MSSNLEEAIQARRLQALRQIQTVLNRSRLPTLRACGLTESEARLLVSESLIECLLVKDDCEYLDANRVQTIGAAGLAILARADVVEPNPIRVAVVPPAESLPSRIFQETRSGLWDLIKVVFGAVVGWYLKKYFP